METKREAGSSPMQVTLSTGAARNTQLRSQLRDLNPSAQIQTSNGARHSDGVNIALLGEHAQTPPRCIVISTVDDEDAQRQALKSGAAALITPATTTTELRAIITAVHHGLAVLPPHLAQRIARRLQTPPNMAPLTATQQQLLQLLTTGHTLKQASATTGYSERHARRQLRQLWDTLKTPNQTAGIIQATRYGLTDQPPHEASRLPRRTGHKHINDTGRRPQPKDQLTQSLIQTRNESTPPE